MIGRPYFTARALAAVLALALILSACQGSRLTRLREVPTVVSNLPNTGQQATDNVVVKPQALIGNTVVVEDIVSQGPGWIAIHNQVDGKLGGAIGHAPVKAGDNRNVRVTIDAAQATDTMYAMLHVDAGQVGVYEFPGPDVPAMADGQMVSPPFAVDLGKAGANAPKVVVSDQDARNGLVKITEVFSKGPGWIAIHVQNPDGSPGQEIGYTAVQDGDNRDLAVTIDARKATATLIAMLHSDQGEIGTYEYPGPDTPQVLNGQMIAPTFKSGLAAAQAAAQAAGTQPVETQSPTQAAEMPGMSATQAPATAAATAAVTAAAGGDQGMVMVTTAPGGVQPLVQVSDQLIQNGTVKVDRVVSDGPGWVVIYTQGNNSQPADAIGEAPVPAGESHDIVVKIDAPRATAVLYAMLHVDAGKEGAFEFPGPDQPIMLGVQMIQAQFALKSAPPTANPSTANKQPFVKVSDQYMRGGTVRIDEIYSQGPGWMGVHNVTSDGKIGVPFGYTQVNTGDNLNVVVRLDLSKFTATLFAMLHIDAGEIGTLEFPGPDVPAMWQNQMIAPRFKITGGMPGSPVVLNVKQNGGQPPFLVDGAGNALYVSLSDTAGKSTCDALCRFTWIPLIATGKLSAGNGVAANKLGVAVLADGTRQVTYAGLPLYYYAKDVAPGDITGQGLDGSWFLAAP